jgi:nucleotide-binding universal stress UspA family protein
VAERDVSLIVMGARNHSRLLPEQFGGITRFVLNEASLPLLMDH